MTDRCLLTLIAAARSEFRVEIATNASLVSEAFCLRHQVYCVERAYEAGRNGLEHDVFDMNARQVLLRSRRTRQVVGTVRVVLPGQALPMQEIVGTSAIEHLPLHSTGEISRFALSKTRRANVGEAGVLMRLGLMQGILHVSQDAGLTHWCAVMERSLLRLLHATAIYFQPVGPLVEFHGLRQPAAGHIDSIMARMFQDARPVFDYVTADGTLWPSREQRLAA